MQVIVGSLSLRKALFGSLGVSRFPKKAAHQKFYGGVLGSFTPHHFFWEIKDLILTTRPSQLIIIPSQLIYQLRFLLLALSLLLKPSLWLALLTIFRLCFSVMLLPARVLVDTCSLRTRLLTGICRRRIYGRISHLMVRKALDFLIFDRFIWSACQEVLSEQKNADLLTHLDGCLQPPHQVVGSMAPYASPGMQPRHVLA